MAAFTVRFDAFIQKGQKRVLEERNEFRGRLGELGGRHNSTHGSLFILYTGVLAAREGENKDAYANSTLERLEALPQGRPSPT